MKNQYKFLVTGGAGFIGSAVVRNILNKTNHMVINIDKLTYAGNLESLKSVENLANYSFHEIDICNKNQIYDLINHFKPTHIMHLAAESHVDRSIDGPEDFIKTNIYGTYSLLEATRKYLKTAPELVNESFRFHHISTDEVFGDLDESDQLFNEFTPYDPSSPYSASKAASDHLVRAWNKTYNIPTLITNCSNNYGPYHFPEKLIPHVILNALNGKKLPIYGNGQQIRDWLYVDDHADALYHVITRGRVGETYNIGGNNEKTNLEVVHSICEILDELVPNKSNDSNHFKDLITFVPDRPGHDKRYAIDSTKIQKELNWKPSESFDSGLRKTIKWFIENREWWENILSGDYKMHRLGKNK